nr:hypothetical protein [Tanacetum cinerariifolium]
MTSFGYRSNPRYAIEECSSCGTLYTRDCVCSIGNVEDKILVPKPPKNCARCTRCGYLVDGPNCQGCALLRQELKENLVTHFQDFQNTSEPSNASTNIVNDPREPYDAHIGYNCPSNVPVISEPCNNQTIDELPTTLPIFHPTFHSEAESTFTLDSTPTYSMNLLTFSTHLHNLLSKHWKLLVCYDDDDDEERSDSLDDNIISGLPPISAITPDEPVLSTEEPDNSLSMGDEHLDTIPAMESDEFINESEGIPEHACDVPSHDNSPPLDISKDQIEDFFESNNEEFSSIDDDSFSIH